MPVMVRVVVAGGQAEGRRRRDRDDRVGDAVLVLIDGVGGDRRVGVGNAVDHDRRRVDLRHRGERRGDRRVAEDEDGQRRRVVALTVKTPVVEIAWPTPISVVIWVFTGRFRGDERPFEDEAAAGQGAVAGSGGDAGHIVARGRR